MGAPDGRLCDSARSWPIGTLGGSASRTPVGEPAHPRPARTPCARSLPRNVEGEGGLLSSPVFLNVHPGQQARVSRTRGWHPRWRTRPTAESRECDPKRADRCGHGRLPGPHRGPGASVKGHPRCRPAGGPCCERDDAAGGEPAASLLCGQDPRVRRGPCGCAGEALAPRERSARCPVARHEGCGPRCPPRRHPPTGPGGWPTAPPILQGRGRGGRR